MSELPKLYSIPQLVAKGAPFHGKSEDWVYRRLWKGEFKGVQLGKSWRMSAEQVREALGLDSEPEPVQRSRRAS